MTLKKKSFENIAGKGENAGNQHFLTMFSTSPKKIVCFSVTFTLPSANALNLNQSKNLSFGKELICHLQIVGVKSSPKFRVPFYLTLL